MITGLDEVPVQQSDTGWLSGAIDKDDCAVMVPELEGLVKEHGSVQLLCDLTDFTSERPSAWGDDLEFGRESTQRSREWPSSETTTGRN